MADEIEFLAGVWGDSERGAIQTNAKVLDRVEKKVRELEAQVARQHDEIVDLRSMILGLGALLKLKVLYGDSELAYEVKAAYDQLVPPPPIVPMSTDPYRGLPAAEPEDSDEAKRLMKTAQDHHFSKQFGEARAIYQDIVERFPRSKQAVTAEQQIKNLHGV